MKTKQKLGDLAQETMYTDWSKMEPHEKRFINNMVYKPAKPPLKPELRSPEIQYNPDDGRTITYKPFARTGKYTADKYNKLTSAARRKFDKKYNIFEDIPVKEEYKIPITKNKQYQPSSYTVIGAMGLNDNNTFEDGNITVNPPVIQDLLVGVEYHKEYHSLLQELNSEAENNTGSKLDPGYISLYPDQKKEDSFNHVSLYNTYRNYGGMDNGDIMNAEGKHELMHGVQDRMNKDKFTEDPYKPYMQKIMEQDPYMIDKLYELTEPLPEGYILKPNEISPLHESLYGYFLTPFEANEAARSMKLTLAKMYPYKDDEIDENNLGKHLDALDSRIDALKDISLEQIIEMRNNGKIHPSDLDTVFRQQDLLRKLNTPSRDNPRIDPKDPNSDTLLYRAYKRKYTPTAQNSRYNNNEKFANTTTLPFLHKFANAATEAANRLQSEQEVAEFKDPILDSKKAPTQEPNNWVLNAMKNLKKQEGWNKVPKDNVYSKTPRHL